MTSRVRRWEDLRENLQQHIRILTDEVGQLSFKSNHRQIGVFRTSLPAISCYNMIPLYFCMISIGSMITIISSHITTVIPPQLILPLASQAWPLEVRAARQALLRPSLSAGWSLTEHAALTRRVWVGLGAFATRGLRVFRSVPQVSSRCFLGGVFWNKKE